MPAHSLSFPELPAGAPIPGGDAPGDKVLIGEGHVAKAQAVFPALWAMVEPRISRGERTVVAVHGGSGVGKSEVGALLGYYFQRRDIGAYVLSGDNYPYRNPRDNDRQRLSTYRDAGLKGLVASGEYGADRRRLLGSWQDDDRDSDPGLAEERPWMASYQEAGRASLEEYLGSPLEIDFGELNRILAAFHAGAPSLWLRRLGRGADELWYDSVDVSGTKVLVLEWTHGNSPYLEGVDVPVLLYSTPDETLEHRRRRNRDGAVDSPFTTLVLQIEQRQILARAHAAAIVVNNDATLGKP